MSYQSISVKEAVNNINANNNGWFLPAIQRPYVWGSRHESEKYICKLFDSIMRGYPIGGLILWKTSEKIAYREFIDNFVDGKIPKLVEEGLWNREDKWLVYDGQQRLQTLYSCLKYSFNNKILVFDLLFNRSDKEDIEETGFSFAKNNSELEPNVIKINNLFAQNPNNKIEYRKSILSKSDWTNEQENIIETNIDALWKIFVEEDKKSLAYFPIVSSNEEEVNEIFQRLNSGGVQLSKSDLLLSKIKEKKYNFEEQLQSASREIFDSTGQGYYFDAYNVLQLLHLFVKGRVRVDTKLNDDELNEFIEEWEVTEEPLKEFFLHFIWEQFKINNASIIPRKICLLPLIAYTSMLAENGVPFRKISESNLTLMKKYFIKSQLNDWNLQSYIDNFYEILEEDFENSDGEFKFPLDKFEAHIKKKGNKRNIDIYEDWVEDYVWFSLKILMPQRSYQFKPDFNKTNPEIDHIFPKKLDGMNEEYEEEVDILWNLQPIRGEINGYKLNHHPFEFFTNKIKDKKGNTINGGKYYSEYDYVPELKWDLWKDHNEFIKKRKQIMKDKFEQMYGLKVQEAKDE